MYSTGLEDDEYFPLLVVYLTTTGPLLQDHTKAELISYALKTVVYKIIGQEPLPIDILSEIRANYEEKRNTEEILRQKQEDKKQEIEARNRLIQDTVAKQGVQKAVFEPEAKAPVIPGAKP